MALELQAVVSLNNAGYLRSMSALRRNTTQALSAIGLAFGGVTAEMMTMTRAFGPMGAAVTTLKQAATVGGEFEQSMANVASVTGLTGAALDGLADSSRELARSTKFTAGQTADALYSLGSAGINTAAQLEDALRPALLLAGATMSDTSVATETLTAVIKNLRLPFSDAERVADQFAGAVATSPATMQRLADAMKFAGPAAGAFKVGLEQLVTELAAFHQAGIRGQQAGTSFRQALIKLNEAALSGAGQVGAAMDGWNASTEGITGAVKRLEAAGVSTQVVVAELGARAGTGLAALLNLGSAAIDNLGTRIESAADVTAMYATQMDTLQGRLAIVKSEFAEVALKIYDRLQPAFEVAVELFRRLAVAIGGMVGSNQFQAFVETAAAVMGALAPVLANALAAVVAFFGGAINMVKGLIAWWGQLSGFQQSLMLWGVGIAAASVAMHSLGVAVVTFAVTTLPKLIAGFVAGGTAFMTSFVIPITAGLLTVGAVLAGLAWAKTFREISLGVFSVGEAMDMAFSAMLIAAQTGFALSKAAWVLGWSQIKLAVLQIVDGLVTGIVQGRLVPLVQGAASAMDSLVSVFGGDKLGDAIAASAANLAATMQGLLAPLGAAADAARGDVAAAMDGMGAAMEDAARRADIFGDQFADAVESATGGTAMDSMSDFGAAMKTNIVGAMDAVAGATKSAMNAMGDAITGQTAKTDALESAVGDVDKAAKATGESFKSWDIGGDQVLRIVHAMDEIGRKMFEIRQWGGFEVAGLAGMIELLREIKGLKVDDLTKLGALGQLNFTMGGSDITAIRAMMERMEGVVWA